MTTESISVSSALMFIGGGSASTAGGIKVTTFFLLAHVDLVGDPRRAGRGRRPTSDRQLSPAGGASVALLGVALVAVGVLLVEALPTGSDSSTSCSR